MGAQSEANRHIQKPGQDGGRTQGPAPFQKKEAERQNGASKERRTQEERTTMSEKSENMDGHTQDAERAPVKTQNTGERRQDTRSDKTKAIRHRGSADKI